MSIWGRIICGSIGAAIGGPVGAVIGAAIGGDISDDSVESKRSSSRNSNSSQFSDKEAAMVSYFVCFFSCLSKIAKADGHVSKDEILVIEELIKMMDLSVEGRRFAIKIFSEAKDNTVSASEYLQQFAKIIQYDDEIGLSLVHCLFTVANADGEISSEERRILQEAESIFRLRPGIIDSLVGNKTDLSQAYKILECTPNMSDSEIKRAYRSKCLDYHPDRLVSKGLPPEFIEFANDKMVKIHESYKMIMSARKRELANCMA